MSKIFDEIMAKRGFNFDFLSPKYSSEKVYLPDIDVAMKRIKKAVKNHEKVMIYGDYDVDGVTASTVMYDALTAAGLEEVEIMLPDRFIDGYGMSERCVDFAKNKKVSLVITVDCGSSNSAVIEELTAAGIDTIVTDHHEVLGDLPKAIAVVNPKRKDFTDSKDSKYTAEELKELAGVGVAFMVAKALVADGLIKDGQEKWLMDLVLIGTICDSMKLTGVNRELCFYGMKVLERTRRPGLVELMRVAGVSDINSTAIGFLIGPRLNAGGRMESANISLDLLMSKSRAEATILAAKLDKLNSNRKAEQNGAMQDIEKRNKDILGIKSVEDSPVIVVADKWHEGVLGIIAGRLVEKYYKPAFALSEVEDIDMDSDGIIESSEMILKGSGRTFGDFNLAEALKACRGEIIGGGGHAGACGIKIKKDNFDNFCKCICDYYISCDLKDQEKYKNVIDDVSTHDLSEMNIELIEDLSKLEPFGNGNEEPIFALRNMFVLDVSSMGSEKQHLRISIRDEYGKNLKLVAFNARKEWFDTPLGEARDFWVKISKNEWNGRVSVQGQILQIK